MSFGSTLREMRMSRQLSLRALSSHVNYSYSYLSKIETGERRPPLDLAQRLDVHFNTGAVFQALMSYGEKEAPGPVAELVPGNTVTGRVTFMPPTRRSLLSGSLAIAALSVITRGHSFPPPSAETFGTSTPTEFFRLAFERLVDEDNTFGPQYVIPKVQRQVAQIESLLPSSGTLDGAELRAVQAHFAEFCGWLYQDYGDHQAAHDWLMVALSKAEIAGDAALRCYILARQSQLAGDMQDERTAVDAAQAAARCAPDARLRAIAQVYGAHGHALAGSSEDSERGYGTAEQLAASDTDSPWGVWLDGSYIAVHRAWSLVALNRFEPAIEAYGNALAGLSPAFHRDRGVYLARMALAHAGNRDPDSAADAGLSALGIALDTQSGRIATHLARLAHSLRGHESRRAREFQDEFRKALS